MRVQTRVSIQESLKVAKYGRPVQNVCAEQTLHGP
jgi:hypothetical protein